MKNIGNFYIILLILVGFYPDLSNPIDYKGLHWMLYSGINTFFLLYFLINYKKIELPKSPILLSFLSLFIISCFSVFVAINKVESIVRLTDLYVVLSTLAISFVLIKQKLINLRFILWVIIVKLSIELIQVYYQFYFYTNGFKDSFEGGFSQYLKSNYGNKNVTSFAFLCQSSLAMIMLFKIKSRLAKTLISILIFATFYILFYISTRAALLSLFLSVIIISLLFAYKFFILRRLYVDELKKVGLYIFMIAASYSVFIINNQDQDINVTDRVSGLTNLETDESLNNRLRYWTQSLKSIKDRPFLGVGIGNWQIYSTKYDSENIYSYVVPYTTHNDFLEIFAETGVFGFISYLFFFFYIFKKNFNNLISWTESNKSLDNLFILLCFMYFFIDSTINFPLTRPLMQIILILFIIINELINSNYIENEGQ